MSETEQRAFARLAKLPPDFADAFEAFKLAILRRRYGGWLDISADDVIQSLYVLQESAMSKDSP